MDLRVQEVARVVRAKNETSQYPDDQINNIEFDSRKIGLGDLFVALKGERDGHDFISIAFENGCQIALSEKTVDYPHLLVDDCLVALQELAAYYLDKTQVDVIAVTGSNGKTTTKDMIYDVLSTTYPTYKTQGNYNNEIGLPYTVLHMPKGTEKLVLEMGQDHLGDIKLLSEIAKPKISVITLFGEAHLEFFGSRDKIAQGKMQIADGMAAQTTLVLPDDRIADPFLPDDKHLVRFGEASDLSLTDLVEDKASLQFKVNFMEDTIHLPVTGKYNATNAMLAAYVGQVMGVSDDHILSALANLHLTKNRTEWKKAKNGADILSDVYNANPTAMRLILETFSNIPRTQDGQKLVVLADMKELGQQSVAMHEAMIDSLVPDVIDKVFCYGDDIRTLSQLAQDKFGSDRVTFYEKSHPVDEFERLLADITQELKPNDQILLKGSNSMNLAKVVESLQGKEEE